MAQEEDDEDLHVNELHSKRQNIKKRLSKSESSLTSSKRDKIKTLEKKGSTDIYNNILILEFTQWDVSKALGYVNEKKKLCITCCFYGEDSSCNHSNTDVDDEQDIDCDEPKLDHSVDLELLLHSTNLADKRDGKRFCEYLFYNYENYQDKDNNNIPFSSQRSTAKLFHLYAHFIIKLGGASNKEKAFRNATTYFSKAIKLYNGASDIAVTYNDLANACKNCTGNFKQCEEYYKEAIKTAPHCSDYVGNYAILLHDNRKFGLCIKACEEAIKLCKGRCKHSYYHCYLGYCEEELGNYDKTLNAYNCALKYNNYCEKKGYYDKMNSIADIKCMEWKVGKIYVNKMIDLLQQSPPNNYSKMRGQINKCHKILSEYRKEFGKHANNGKVDEIESCLILMANIVLKNSSRSKSARFGNEDHYPLSVMIDKAAIVVKKFCNINGNFIDGNCNNKNKTKSKNKNKNTNKTKCADKDLHKKETNTKTSIKTKSKNHKNKNKDDSGNKEKKNERDETAAIIKNLQKENAELQKMLQQTKNKVKIANAKYNNLSKVIDALKIIKDEGIDINVDDSDKDGESDSLNSNSNSNQSMTSRRGKQVRSPSALVDHELNVVKHTRTDRLNELKHLIDDEYGMKSNDGYQIDCVTNGYGSTTEDVIISAIKEFLGSMDDIDLIDNESNEYMEKFTVKNCAIGALNDQYGIRAKKDIKKHTIIARYTGTEMLNSEFEEKYPNKIEYSDHQRYLFTVDFIDDSDLNGHGDKSDESISDEESIETNAQYKGKRQHKKLRLIAKLKPPAKRRKLSNRSRLENIKLLKKQYKYFVVEPNPDKKALSSLINDCRKDITKEELTNDDKKRFNVDFKIARVNGWRMIFVMAMKDLKKGDHLYAYYGKDYYTSIRGYNFFKACGDFVQSATTVIANK